MLLVRRLPIRHTERSFVPQRIYPLQQLYFGNDPLAVHWLK